MIIDILRAKSKENKNYLLKDHLKETILQAIQLRDFINQNKSAVKYDKFNDIFFENLIITCFLHDLGKINWKFQRELFTKEEKEYDLEVKRYKNNELNQLSDFFSEFKDIDIKDHEIISLIYSLIFLENNEWDKKVRTAILLHHYNEFYVNKDINIRNILTEYPDLENYIKFLIKNEEKINDLLKNLLENITNNFSDEKVKNIVRNFAEKINFNKIKEFKEYLDKDYGLSTKLKLFEIADKESKNFYDFFVFLGCLRRCDYSASGNVKIEEIQNLGETVYRDFENKIKRKFEQKINPGKIWQEKIIAQNDSDNLVLVAPTGSGKTEFALLWSKNKGKKLIYTLPLRVALNDLYWRFSDKENGYFDNDFLRILHSTSFIEYLKEEKEGEDLDINTKQTTATLFSSPLTLTTPDQVFLSSLKYYGFDKLISIYPLSTIVIDEIQAYNPEMAAVIIKTLKIIKELNGNVLIITATFPSYFEEFINEENGFKIIDSKNIKENDQIKNYRIQRHKIEIINSESLFEYEEQKNGDLKLKINKQPFKEVENKINQNKNKNILIILNNVAKAIELYKKLEEETEKFNIKKENLYLLHSRLLEKEKNRRITEIKEKLKNLHRKKEITCNERIILVATQIVEAAVDVDFDILLTEISPVDSQIQRWGRVYRNRSCDYSDKLSNIFIFKGIDRGTSAIYDIRVIEKTIEILEKYQNQLLSYEEEREIIKKVFESRNEDQTLKDIFVDEINKNLEWLNYYSVEKRSEAQRIFRRMAGIQIVLPQVMEEEGDDIIKSFGKIINNSEDKNISWEAIIEEIKKETNKNTDMWLLKKILYDYSTSMPMFYFKKIQNIIPHDFREFFVLNLKDVPRGKIEEIVKYGIDVIKEDIDYKEIEEFSAII